MAEARKTRRVIRHRRDEGSRRGDEPQKIIAAAAPCYPCRMSVLASQSLEERKRGDLPRRPVRTKAHQRSSSGPPRPDCRGRTKNGPYAGQ